MEKLLTAHTPESLAQLFSTTEITDAGTGAGRAESLAARFAAKEATMKALGTGIRGVRWRDIEVLPNRRGKPIIVLHETAKRRAELLGLTHWSISLTHSRGDAMAIVVASKSQPPSDRADGDTVGP
jgi:holo-[acyl-carrier protein] synthase